MKPVPFILLFLAAAGIGISTFVEDAHDTPFVQTYVYGTWWFKLLWTTVVVTSAALFAHRKMWKNLPLLILHLSFGVIFTGALTTAFTGHKGILHLRKGQPTGEYVNERKQVARLPFVMRLDSFRIEYYPGTEAPADYVSQISCQHVEGDIFAQPAVSMNRIFSAQGYRFYQSSYDEDGEGSWLSVNYDPWGTGITYAGFCLMGLGCLLLLCARDGGFRRLLRHPLIRKGGLFLITLFWGFQLKADPALPVVKRIQADSLAIQQVVYNDRVAPFNTLARDFVQKVYGRPTFHGITPEQVVSSWMLPRRMEPHPHYPHQKSGVAHRFGPERRICLARSFVRRDTIQVAAFMATRTRQPEQTGPGHTGDGRKSRTHPHAPARHARPSAAARRSTSQ